MMPLQNIDTVLTCLLRAVVLNLTNPNVAHHAECYSLCAEHNKKITFSFTIHIRFYINKKITKQIEAIMFLCKII